MHGSWWLTFLFLAACTTQPQLPHVRLEMHETDLLPEYVTGVSAWTELGFEIVDEIEPKCERNWYETGEVDCQITLIFVRYHHLREEYGTNALSEISSRSIVIDDREADTWTLTIASAHETGHILLDTDRHTQGGVMGGSSTVLTSVDRDLACETIHVCD